MTMTKNSFVLSVSHLQDRPNADHALDLLNKAVSLVRPIMRKHSWMLPKLAEFFPEDPNLLGELRPDLRLVTNVQQLTSML
jgi:WLM domain